MIMRQPQRAYRIVKKLQYHGPTEPRPITYWQNVGWRFIDKAKETFSLRPLVPECEFTVLNIRTGSRWDIFNKIITRALLLAILHSHPPETWNYQFGRYFIPSLKHIYQVLAISVRIQGLQNAPSLHKHVRRPLGKSIAEARKYFDKLYSRSFLPNSKIVQELLTRFLISADHYDLLSNNFLSLVRTLSDAVYGDKKLLHTTGNSGHIIAVKEKLAQVRPLFYQLVGC